MNQTNRADAAQKYLESISLANQRMRIEFQFKTAMPSGPWWRDKELRLAKLPRIRFVHNLGVYQLTATNGVRVFGNDIESTYLLWIKSELDRNAYEDYDDFPAFGYVEDTARLPLLRTLAGSAVVLLIIATAAFICFAFR